MADEYVNVTDDIHASTEDDQWSQAAEEVSTTPLANIEISALINAMAVEGSPFKFLIKFWDRDGVLSTPTSATWKVNDNNSGTELGAGNLSAESVTELILENSVQSICNDVLSFEKHTLTVVANDAGSRVIAGEAEFYVKNLKFYAVA
jgi:hypothetical protein